MSRIAYVNGRYVPHGDAAVHIEDRGYQFADGVYEVIAVIGGKLVDEEPHLDRLDYSLNEIEIDWPVPPAAMRSILREVVRQNRVTDGIVYLQVSRGQAQRDHGFPDDPAPALVVTARSQAPKAAAREDGVRVITTEDQRWKRVDIKTVGLLPNVLAKQEAVRAGAAAAAADALRGRRRLARDGAALPRRQPAPVLLQREPGVRPRPGRRLTHPSSTRHTP